MDRSDFDEFRRRVETVPIKTVVRTAVLIIVAVGLLWGALTSFYTVDADEVTVVLRFGKHIKTTPHGLHGKLPFGIHTIHLVKVERVHKLEFGFRESGESRGRPSPRRRTGS